MKNRSLYAAALMIIAGMITSSSCKKDEEPTCPAGAGGNVEIVVFAKHNGTLIINSLQHPDTAFVKYGTTTSPGINPIAYDTFYVSEENEDHIHLPGLKCGSYYIYRTAYDTTTHTRYTGGLGLSFTKTTGDVDTTIIVN